MLKKQLQRSQRQPTFLRPGEADFLEELGTRQRRPSRDSVDVFPCFSYLVFVFFVAFDGLNFAHDLILGWSIFLQSVFCTNNFITVTSGSISEQLI